MTGVAIDAHRAAVADVVRAHEITSLRVLHQGRVAISVGAQDVAFPINFIRKSIVSALFGQVIAQGRVQLDTTLADLGIDDAPGLTALERSATLEHLLTSSSGVHLPLAFTSSYDVFDDTPVDWPERGSAAPGTQFHYSNWDFNVLGEIYQRVTETSLFVAIDRLLAHPLGFRDWNPFEHTRLYYVHDPVGATPRFPYYAMRLSARDLACFGQLYLNRGMCNGRQLVPADWVQRSTQCAVQTGLPSPFRHYGFLWWTINDHDPAALPAGSFSTIGLGGQTLSVIPDRQVVIVALRVHREGGNTQMAPADDVVNAVLGCLAAQD